MENERPNGDEAPLEPERLNFIKSWQRRLGFMSEIYPLKNKDVAEEAEDTQELKPDKKWPNYFSRVFSDIVRPAPIDLKPSPEDVLSIQPAKSDVYTHPDTLPAPKSNTGSESKTLTLETAREAASANKTKVLYERSPKTPESLEKPEKVLEKVVQAAEKNDPLEIAYERRHEIKDEPAKQIGATPVNTILKNSNTDDQSVFTAATKQIINNQKAYKSKSTVMRELPKPYRHAIKHGFWSAVALIVLTGIFIVLRG